MTNLQKNLIQTFHLIEAFKGLKPSSEGHLPEESIKRLDMLMENKELEEL